MYEKITPQNVVMYAIKNYDNPQCEGEKEFADVLRFLVIHPSGLSNMLRVLALITELFVLPVLVVHWIISPF